MWRHLGNPETQLWDIRMLVIHGTFDTTAECVSIYCTVFKIDKTSFLSEMNLLHAINLVFCRKSSWVWSNMGLISIHIVCKARPNLRVNSFMKTTFLHFVPKLFTSDHKKLFILTLILPRNVVCQILRCITFAQNLWKCCPNVKQLGSSEPFGILWSNAVHMQNEYR